MQGGHNVVTSLSVVASKNHDLCISGALAIAASQVEVSADPGSVVAKRKRQEVMPYVTDGGAIFIPPAGPYDERQADADRDDADRAVTALYSSHYRSLVRLAALLVRDVATAEEVVQDSFVAMHGGWRRLRDSDKALSYLRQSVVNRSRSVLRHRVVVDRNE